ncbi:MAG: hypothetical protein J6A16_03660, partial [Oscillospiraceae bacterium]|nr:hypothetical protein [Oscillospiraceae bacterium]
MHKRFLSIILAAAILTGCAAENTAPIDTPVVQTTATSATTTTAVTTVTTTATTTSTASTTEAPPEESTEAPEPQPTTASVNILCAGDNLIHQPIYNQASVR